MKSIFDYDNAQTENYIRPLTVKKYSLSKQLTRANLDLPDVSEYNVVRHYTKLSKMAFGVDDGFYPLGSCTMKYNPKLNEEVAALKGFTKVHPLQSADTLSGCVKVCKMLSESLKEITGMDACTLQPAAGAHGEFTGLLLIKKYHESGGDFGRKKIIVPDSAHGTNPASAAMAGFEVVEVKSNSEKGVDVEQLRQIVGEDTAALMLTNPTTLGLFEKNIVEIADIIHKAGGLLYYDGANLNAVMGIARPKDMGFDVVHFNLHKTFSTPHGGGGPGSGPVCCTEDLKEFLPYPVVNEDFKMPQNSVGKVTAFYGNFSVMVKALCYILTLGGKGLKEASTCAVLNANYLKSRLQKVYDTDSDRYCMHEFVLSLQKLKDETGVSAIDVAKSLIDFGIHPPTMYFPLIVHEALMFEPTESATKEMLDETAEVMLRLYEEAKTNPEKLHLAPHNAVISRPDEVKAAKDCKLRY